jgi:hypothetical protein
MLAFAVCYDAFPLILYEDPLRPSHNDFSGPGGFPATRVRFGPFFCFLCIFCILINYHQKRRARARTKGDGYHDRGI